MKRKRNRPLKDYSGIKFGRLTAVTLIEREWTQNNHRWLFLCDCGKEKIARIKQVRSGHTLSCGCLAREGTVARNTKHGLSRAHRREYVSWKNMRARCRTETDSDYAEYGARGISVCPRWDDFAAFMSDMGECPDGMTIDRIEVNGNYEPANCRWATAWVQANNKRSNHNITINGETQTLQQWADHYGVEASKARYRLSVGYSPTEAFSNRDMRNGRSHASD